jgi:eukaryotic-like serine/threonine-protein kinase
MFPQLFGKYVLERELAGGGMARVFLATLRGARGFEKRLVVKQIRPELASDQAFIQRFVSEAKTTVELSHSNIVPVYELGVEQGTYYIALEFCEGVPLAELLAKAPLTPAEGAHVGVEICRALDYAHRRASVVHRDVTPRNVMIDAEGMVRLIDFGIAAPVSSAGERGNVFGSPGHMPPEQLRGEPLTPAADVFAVGALLIEAWTQHAPFRKDSVEACLRALKEPRPDIAQHDPALAPLATLVRQAIDNDPKKRPQSADELARPLRDFLKSSDLGDLARRLGDRVARLLDEQHSVPAASPPPRPASGCTQTFASADAVLGWTAKIDSQPPRPSDPPRPSQRATSLTPILPFDAFEPAPPSSGLAVHTGPRSPNPSRRMHLLWPALAIAALAIAYQAPRGEPGAVVAAASASPPAHPVDEAPGSRHQAPGSEPGGVVAAASASPPIQPAPATPVIAAAPPSTPSRSLTAPASSPAPVPRPTARRDAAPSARLSLTSDPPAQVKIDGALLGRTPLLHVPLRPGRHRVLFTSVALGEQLETSVELEPTRPLGVHADFTSATPQLYMR